jgi:signal transduction histidine kinase
MDAGWLQRLYSAAVESLKATWRRLAAGSPSGWDIALVAAVAIGGQLLNDYGDHQWLRVPSLLIAIPVAFRRRWPLAVFCITALLVFAAGASNPGVAVAAGVIAAYSVGLYGRHRWVSLGVVLITALMIVVVFGGGLPHLPNYAGPFVILLPFWLVGNLLRVRELRADLFETRARQLEQQQEQSRQAAVLEERGRIARELHDVIAHSVSVMVVQAGAAREVLKGGAPDAPTEATQSLLAVEGSGREALTELRHMLGALSHNGAAAPKAGDSETGDAGIAPQPGLEQLDSLVQRVRETGQPLTLRVTGARRPLSKGVDIAAYRILQEALTNALKYARGAPTEITLDYREHELKIEVTDEGPGAARDSGALGRGLAGMRERVAVFGGRLEIGPRLERGFAVRAWLPLGEPVA